MIAISYINTIIYKMSSSTHLEEFILYFMNTLTVPNPDLQFYMKICNVFYLKIY